MQESQKEQRIRRAIVEVYGELARRGMNSGSSGNISVRGLRSGMLITPTGCTEESLRARDIVRCRLDGAAAGRLRPSSEWAMHAAIYAALPEARAIVHTHADYSAALAALHKPIPPFHYMVGRLGGADVPCAPYHPFGTRALGEAAARALKERTACLLANHGTLTRGRTLREAFDATVLLETLARQYAILLSIGAPVLLTRAQMKIVADQFEDYGRQPRPRVKPRWGLP